MDTPNKPHCVHQLTAKGPKCGPSCGWPVKPPRGYGHAERSDEDDEHDAATKKPAGVVDCTPSWLGLLRVSVMLTQDGTTAEARATGWAELEKMARAADAYNDLVPDSLDLIEAARKAFYEDGSSKALRPVMAKFRPMAEKIRATAAKINKEGK